ncbi:MAG: hypothetical protein QXE81_06155, partial [Desulfurococcaceae archaeon]
MNREKLVLQIIVFFVVLLWLIVWITPIFMVLFHRTLPTASLYNELLSSFTLSINTSLAASVIVIALSIPLSYYISRFAKGFNRRVLMAILLTPLMISPSAIGSALLL